MSELIYKDEASARDIAIEVVDSIDFSTIPTDADEMYASFVKLRSRVGPTYKLDRGVNEVASALNISNSVLRKFFTGKRILDIGCGHGTFCDEIARDKSTTVLGIDKDDVFEDTPRVGKNLDFMQFPGERAVELTEEEGEFDIVSSVYSHLYWADDHHAARDAVHASLDATKDGGSSIFVPVLNNTGVGRTARDLVKDSPEAAGALYSLQFACASALKALLDAEKDGRLALAFKESKRNSVRAHESYSVVARVLDK